MSAFSVSRPRAGAREWRERLLFLLLIGPNVLLLAAFTFWPMIYNAYLSTISWNFLSPIRRFVGLRNYETVLSSEIFRIVLINTAVFTVVSVAATMILGLGLALLLNQPLRWRDGARAVLFTPTVLSGAAIAIIWIYIFDPRFGLLAQILGWFGILSPNWLADPNWAMAALLIVYIWKNTATPLLSIWQDCRRSTGRSTRRPGSTAPVHGGNSGT